MREGHNLLTIMLTGGGKHLCFKIPALILEGVTLVLAPLIALVRDEVHGFQVTGVAVEALTSRNMQEETDNVFQMLAAVQLKSLFWPLNV